MEEESAITTATGIGKKEKEAIRIVAVNGAKGEREEVSEASDPELDELLEVSLNEFGRHAPKDPKKVNASKTTTASKLASEDSADAVPSVGESEMEDAFGAEFLSEVETQLGEAMKVMSDENPQLWQQLDTFTKSLGLEDMGAGPAPPTSGTTTKGESSVDSCSGPVGGASKGEENEGSATEEKKEAAPDPLEHVLEETLKKLQQNTAKMPEGAGAGLGGLEGMMGQMDLGSEESEDQFMKMMQGMMSTLLSKDVLYPSLVELRKQYPDWLEKNCNSVPEADLKRYKKQLQIMTGICDEFDKPGGGDGQSQASSERILQLMQELQQYGQPPADLATEAQAGMPGMPPGMPGLPPGMPGIPGMPPGMMGNMDGQNCSIM